MPSSPDTTQMELPFCCLACARSRCADVYKGCVDYFASTPFIVDYVRCDHCGLVQQHPVPKDVSEYYRDYPVHQSKSGLFDSVRKMIMRPVYYWPGAGENPALLDYGCGDGGYLDWVRELADPIGYEPAGQQAATLSHRLALPVYADREHLLRERAGRFDVVTMHFVVEHVTDLHGLFKDIFNLLKPGGLFYFVVPHLNSIEAKLFRRRWHGLDPPRHISFVDRAIVDRLAAEHGFEDVADRAVPFPNGIAGSLASCFGSRFSSRLFLLSLPLGIVASRLLPTGCRAYRLTKVSPRR